MQRKSVIEDRFEPVWKIMREQKDVRSTLQAIVPVIQQLQFNLKKLNVTETEKEKILGEWIVLFESIKDKVGMTYNIISMERVFCDVLYHLAVNAKADMGYEFKDAQGRVRTLYDMASAVPAFKGVLEANNIRAPKQATAQADVDAKPVVQNVSDATPVNSSPAGEIKPVLTMDELQAIKALTPDGLDVLIRNPQLLSGITFYEVIDSPRGPVASLRSMTVDDLKKLREFVAQPKGGYEKEKSNLNAMSDALILFASNAIKIEEKKRGEDHKHGSVIEAPVNELYKNQSTFMEIMRQLVDKLEEIKQSLGERDQVKLEKFIIPYRELLQNPFENVPEKIEQKLDHIGDVMGAGNSDSIFSRVENARERCIMQQGDLSVFMKELKGKGVAVEPSQVDRLSIKAIQHGATLALNLAAILEKSPDHDGIKKARERARERNSQIEDRLDQANKDKIINLINKINEPDKRESDEMLSDLIVKFDRLVVSLDNQVLSVNEDEIKKTKDKIIQYYVDVFDQIARNTFASFEIDKCENPNVFEEKSKVLDVVSSNIADGIGIELSNATDIRQKYQIIERYLSVAERLTETGNYFVAQAIIAQLGRPEVASIFRRQVGEVVSRMDVHFGLSMETIGKLNKLSEFYSSNEDMQRNLVGLAKGRVVEGAHSYPVRSSMLRTVLAMGGGLEELESAKKVYSDRLERISEKDTSKLNEFDARHIEKLVKSYLSINAGEEKSQKMLDELNAYKVKIEFYLHGRAVTLDEFLGKFKNKKMDEINEEVIKKILDSVEINFEAANGLTLEKLSEIKENIASQESRNKKFIRDTFSEQYRAGEEKSDVDLSIDPRKGEGATRFLAINNIFEPVGVLLNQMEKANLKMILNIAGDPSHEIDRDKLKESISVYIEQLRGMLIPDEDEVQQELKDKFLEIEQSYRELVGGLESFTGEINALKKLIEDTELNDSLKSLNQYILTVKEDASFDEKKLLIILNGAISNINQKNNNRYDVVLEELNSLRVKLEKEGYDFKSYQSDFGHIRDQGFVKGLFLKKRQALNSRVVSPVEELRAYVSTVRKENANRMTMQSKELMTTLDADMTIKANEFLKQVPAYVELAVYLEELKQRLDSNKGDTVISAKIERIKDILEDIRKMYGTHEWPRVWNKYVENFNTSHLEVHHSSLFGSIKELIGVDARARTLFNDLISQVYHAVDMERVSSFMKTNQLDSNSEKVRELQIVFNDILDYRDVKLKEGVAFDDHKIKPINDIFNIISEQGIGLADKIVNLEKLFLDMPAGSQKFTLQRYLLSLTDVLHSIDSSNKQASDVQKTQGYSRLQAYQNELRKRAGDMIGLDQQKYVAMSHFLIGLRHCEGSYNQIQYINQFKETKWYKILETHHADAVGSYKRMFDKQSKAVKLIDRLYSDLAGRIEVTRDVVPPEAAMNRVAEAYSVAENDYERALALMSNPLIWSSVMKDAKKNYTDENNTYLEYAKELFVLIDKNADENIIIEAFEKCKRLIVDDIVNVPAEVKKRITELGGTLTNKNVDLSQLKEEIRSGVLYSLTHSGGSGRSIVNMVIDPTGDNQVSAPRSINEIVQKAEEFRLARQQQQQVKKKPQLLPPESTDPLKQLEQKQQLGKLIEGMKNNSEDMRKYPGFNKTVGALEKNDDKSALGYAMLVIAKRTGCKAYKQITGSLTGSKIEDPKAIWQLTFAKLTRDYILKKDDVSANKLEMHIRNLDLVIKQSNALHIALEFKKEYLRLLGGANSLAEPKLTFLNNLIKNLSSLILPDSNPSASLFSSMTSAYNGSWTFNLDGGFEGTQFNKMSTYNDNPVEGISAFIKTLGVLKEQTLGDLKNKQDETLQAKQH